MKKIDKKYTRVLAAAVGLSLLLSSVVIARWDYITGVKDPAKALTEEDRRIADEVSNMTGVKVEDVMRLKAQGRTWNEVLEKMKNYPSTGRDGKDRLKALEQSGLDIETVEKLKKDGFTEDEIIEARMLSDRVVYMLKEITQGIDDTAIPSVGPGIEEEKEEEEDLSPYRELLDKIGTTAAVKLALQSKKELGGLEKALDEYLISLQLEIDLSEYLTDKKAYGENKKQKSLGVDMDKLLTMEKIEAKMLEEINKRNRKDIDKSGPVEDGRDSAEELLPGGKKGGDDLPEPPLPDTGDPRPKDPREEVMKEIEDIKERSLNVEGR